MEGRSVSGGNFLFLAIVCFLSIISVLIVLHELGHYLAARFFGLKPQVFSLGFGPELAGFSDRHGTRWKISPIPLGGYVKFHGEMHPGTGTQEEASHPQSFARLPRWQRAVVIFAGPFANILVTACIMGFLFTNYGIPRVGSVVQEVVAGSPAAKAGIMTGDNIVTWNGKSSDGSQDLVRYIKINPGKTLDLTISRKDETLHKEVLIDRVSVEDRFKNQAEIGKLGVTFPRYLEKVDNPFSLLLESGKETRDLFTLQIETIWQMIKGERPLREVSGPVRLAKMSGEQFILGWLPVVYFTAMLSIAIAFTNLLPIPGLDGGYLFLYAIEGLKRKNLSKATMLRTVKVGYGLVAIMTIFGFSNDIRVLFF